MSWVVKRRFGDAAELAHLEETLASGVLDDPRFEVDRLTVQKHLGKLYAFFERYEEAEALQRETVDGLLAAVGEEHELTAGALEGLGTTLCMTEQYEEATVVLERALRSARLVWGDAYHTTLLIYANLGVAYARLGRLEEAAPLLREAIADGVPLVSRSERVQRLNNLAIGLLKLGRLEEAEPHAIAALEQGRAIGYRRMDEVIEAVQNLAKAFLSARGRRGRPRLGGAGGRTVRAPRRVRVGRQRGPPAGSARRVDGS